MRWLYNAPGNSAVAVKHKLLAAWLFKAALKTPPNQNTVLKTTTTRFNHETLKTKIYEASCRLHRRTINKTSHLRPYRCEDLFFLLAEPLGNSCLLKALMDRLPGGLWASGWMVKLRERPHGEKKKEGNPESQTDESTGNQLNVCAERVSIKPPREETCGGVENERSTGAVCIYWIAWAHIYLCLLLWLSWADQKKKKKNQISVFALSDNC